MLFYEMDQQQVLHIQFSVTACAFKINPLKFYLLQNRYVYSFNATNSSVTVFDLFRTALNSCFFSLNICKNKNVVVGKIL